MPDHAPRFLIVSNASALRRIIRMLLKQLGHEHYDEAEDGADALNLLRTHRYQLVISDWDMPVINGTGLVKAMRADRLMAATPFLMLVMQNAEYVIAEAMAAGANDCMTPPIMPDTLRGKLDRLLAR